MEFFKQNFAALFLVLLLGILYGLTPTINANIDSWYYAACVKYGDELLNSHHLLFNLFGRLLYKCAHMISPGFEPIDSLKLMNAVAGFFSLIVLLKILLRLNPDPRTAMVLVLIPGVSFGFMRFTTDAETYVLPVLFSLISTFYYIKSKTKYSFILASLFASIAILMHQLQIWWTLSMFLHFLFIRKRKFNEILRFSLPLLLVPLVYFIAYMIQNMEGLSFSGFITGEYSKGKAGIDISLSSLVMTCINFIRTFIQVHGQILILIRLYPIVAASVAFVIISLIIVILLKGAWKNMLVTSTGLEKYHLLFFLAFVLHLIFAFVSSGNAEFMVMLPFLLVMWMASKFELRKKSLLYLKITILCIWNLAFGILPAHFIVLNTVDKQVEITLNAIDGRFIWKEKPLIENKISYEVGFGFHPEYLRPEEVNNALLDSLLNLQITVYTDLPNESPLFTREGLLQGNKNEMLFDNYKLVILETYETFYGNKSIYVLEAKE